MLDRNVDGQINRWKIGSKIDRQKLNSQIEW